MLKKLLNSLLLLLLALCMDSCSKDSEDDPTGGSGNKIGSISVSPAEIALDAAGGSVGNFKVITRGSWVIYDCPDWLILSSDNGRGESGLTVTALSPNTETTARTATLVVMNSNGNSASLVINQLPPAEVPHPITLSPEMITLGGEAGSEAQVAITTDGAWTLSNIPAWLHSSATTGSGNSTITISTTSANSSTLARTANLTVATSSHQASLGVIQQVADNGSGNSQGSTSSSTLNASPYDILPMSTSISFAVSCGKDVATFAYKVVSATASSQAVLNMLEAESRNTVEESLTNVFANINLDPNTSYDLALLAYDSDGNAGAVTRHNFKTTNTNVAYASVEISNLRIESDLFKADVTPNSLTGSYYMELFLDDTAESLMSSGEWYVAYLMKYGIDTGEYTPEQTGATTWRWEFTGDLPSKCCLCIWACDKSGNLAPTVTWAGYPSGAFNAPAGSRSAGGPKNVKVPKRMTKRIKHL